MHFRIFSGTTMIMVLVTTSMLGFSPILLSQGSLSGEGLDVSNRDLNDTSADEAGVPLSIPAFTRERQKNRLLNAVMSRSVNETGPDFIRPPARNSPSVSNPAFPQKGSMRTAGMYGYWRPTYFPDVGVARLNYVMSIGYLSSPRILHIELSNENETLSRILTVFVDGTQKHSTTISGQSPQVTFDCSSWCSPYTSYLLTIEVRYGAYGRGWRLDNLWIDDGVVTFNAYRDNADMTAPWKFSYQTFEDYAYFADDYIAVIPKITASFSTTGPYSRYVDLYLNGYYVGRQISFGDSTPITWDLPIAVEQDFTNSIVEIRFRVYIPCSSCTSERWMLNDWNTEFIYSWRILLMNETLSFATNWVPPESTRDDIMQGIRYFSMSMFQLFEGQVLYPKFDVVWNMNDYDCSYYSDCNWGDFNIFHGSEIPGRGSARAFREANKSYYSENSPDYLGVFGSNKWELVNRQHLGVDWFLFAHEFSHMEFDLKDQYKEGISLTICPNFVMGKSSDINYEVSPNYSDRRHGVPAVCFRDGKPSGYWGDMDKILSNNPIFSDLYYFDHGFETEPSNYFDFLIFYEYFLS